MWNRLGTPTPRAESGTVEEFERAVAALTQHGQPNIWFYFRQAPAKLDTDEQLEQRKKVLAFKKQVQANGDAVALQNPDCLSRTSFAGQMTLLVRFSREPISDLRHTLAYVFGYTALTSSTNPKSIVSYVNVGQLHHQQLTSRLLTFGTKARLGLIFWNRADLCHEGFSPTKAGNMDLGVPRFPLTQIPSRIFASGYRLAKSLTRNKIATYRLVDSSQAVN